MGGEGSEHRTPKGAGRKRHKFPLPIGSISKPLLVGAQCLDHAVNKHQISLVNLNGIWIRLWIRIYSYFVPISVRSFLSREEKEQSMQQLQNCNGISIETFIFF